MTRSRALTLLMIFIVYWASSLVQAPVTKPLEIALPHLVLGPVIVSPPLVLSGDSPHYLVIVNSLLSDGDLDVSNNYLQAEKGSLDAGTRFRGKSLDHHVDHAKGGREYSWHSPYLPLLLAAFAWPLRGTPWVEPACIWLTMLAGIATIWLFGLLIESRCLKDRSGSAGAQSLLLLALATPLWCYSRDLWTEAWLAAAWTALLLVRTPLASFFICFVGILLRYPFGLVTGLTGAILWLQKQRRLAVAMLSSSFIAGAVAVLVAQYVYRDTGHFSLLHFGYHVDPVRGAHVLGPFGFQLDGLWGVFLHPTEGVLTFTPFLAWGLWAWRKGGQAYLPAIAYYLLISQFQAGWGGGHRFLVTLPGADDSCPCPRRCGEQAEEHRLPAVCLVEPSLGRDRRLLPGIGLRSLATGCCPACGRQTRRTTVVAGSVRFAGIPLALKKKATDDSAYGNLSQNRTSSLSLRVHPPSRVIAGTGRSQPARPHLAGHGDAEKRSGSRLGTGGGW